MDLSRIQTVLSSEPNEAQLDKFLADVRDSLSMSSRLFLAYNFATVISIVVYHLIVYGGGTSLAFGGVQISDIGLFRRVFLVFPAATLAATSGVGYLRKLQRDCYDYLSISRYRALGKTGLHELRLPGDYVLGLFMLREFGGALGKLLSYLVIGLSVVAFVFAPTFYVINEAIKNIRLFGLSDWLCLGASVIAIILAGCSILIIRLSGKIEEILTSPSIVSSSPQPPSA